jgi:hypothetical protein
MKKTALALSVSMLLIGCTPAGRIKDVIVEYEKVASQVDLGDSKEQVLAILTPSQADLEPGWKKPPEKYMKDGVLVEIYFLRSGLQSDGITTDDEFTPYIFNNGKLVGLGWSMLGGAKSHGKVIQPAPVINNSTTTIVY